MKSLMKKVGALFAFSWLVMMPGAAQAGTITECYAWVLVSGITVTNDCYLEIFDEPVVVGVDQVYTRTVVDANVYHGATFVGNYSAWDADAADYPGTVTYNGLPYIELTSSVYANVRHGTGIPPTVDTGFDPFCMDGTFSYREYGVTLTYTTRSFCNGYLGFTLQ